MFIAANNLILNFFKRSTQENNVIQKIHSTFFILQDMYAAKAR